MPVTGSIQQTTSDGSIFTDSRNGDIMLRTFCNNSFMFGNGSNTTSTLSINTGLIKFNTTTAVSGGYFGVNTTTPQYHMDVAGNINFTGSLTSNGTIYYSSPWMSNGSNAYFSQGLVGIGTSTPAYNLHVIGVAAASSLVTGNIFTAPTTSSNVLNIGTDSNTRVINIGNTNATINMNGAFEYISTADLFVSDKTVTLNHGGTAGSGGSTGINIEEAGSNTGYILTSSDRNSFLFKAPNATTPLSVNLANSSVNFNANALVINSNNKIGIGTSSPMTTLDVAGVINASSNILINGQALQAGYWLSSGGAVNYSYSNVVIGSNVSPVGVKFYLVSSGTTNQGGTGDMTNITSNIASFYDTNYSRFTHKCGNTSIAAIYNYESNKSVFWGEATDTGTYSFRGRGLAVGYASTPSGGYALDVNGSANIADKLYAANNFSLGTVNLSEKLTIAGGNIALVHGGTYGTATGADKWMSVGDKTQTASPQYQQSNYGINMTWGSNGCYFGLRDYGHKDTVVSFGSDPTSLMRFQFANSNDYMTMTAAGNIGIGNTNPQATLDVNGAVKVVSLTGSNATVSNVYAAFASFSNLVAGTVSQVAATVVSVTASNITASNSTANTLTANTANLSNLTVGPGTLAGAIISASASIQEGGVSLVSKYALSNAPFVQLAGGTMTGTLVGTTMTATTHNGSNAAFSNLTVGPGALTGAVVNATTNLQEGGTNLVVKYALSNAPLLPLAGGTLGGTLTGPTMNATTALQESGVNLTTKYALSNAPFVQLAGGTLSGPLVGTTMTAATLNGSNVAFSNLTVGPGMLTAAIVNATSSLQETGTNLVTKYALSNAPLLPLSGGMLSGTLTAPMFVGSNAMLSNAVVVVTTGSNASFSNLTVGPGILQGSVINASINLQEAGTSLITKYALSNAPFMPLSGGTFTGTITGSNASFSNLTVYGNIGVDKSNPAYPLDVQGIINAAGFYVNGAPLSTSGSSSNGVGSQWGNSATSVFLLGSNVGIGNQNPTRALQVSGDAQFDSNIYLTRGLILAGLKVSMNSNAGLGLPSQMTTVLTQPGTTFSSNSSNTGINNTNPQYTLDVGGIMNAAGVYVNGTPLSTSVGGGFSACNTNTTYSMCNIGIGKSNPAYPLDVAGTVNASAVYINGSPLSTSTGGGFSASNTNTAFSMCNIGIGKSNPSYPLDVVGDLNFTGQLRKNGALYIGSQWSNSATSVFLLGSNVGIGNNNPSCALQVSGDAQFDSNIYLTRGLILAGLKVSMNSNAGLGLPSQMTTVLSLPGYTFASNSSNTGIKNTNPQYTLDVGGILNATSVYVNGAPLSSGTGGGFSAAISNSAYSMCNVGIGKSNPAYPLDVAGTINATAVFINGNPLSTSTGGGFSASNANTTFTNCNVGIGTTTPQYALDVAGTIRGTTSVISPVLQSVAGYIQLLSEHDIYYKADNDGNNGGATHLFFSSSNEKMRIDAAGNVGIGTSTPAYKLDVNGTINATAYNNLPATANYTSFSNWVSPLASAAVSTTTYNAFSNWASPLASAAVSTTTYNAFSNWASPLASAALPTSTYSTFSNWVSPLAKSGFSLSGSTAATGCNVQITGSTTIMNGNNGNDFSGSQIKLGHGSTTNYQHAIKTRHNAGANDTNNAIDLFVWQTSDALTAAGTKHVMSVTSAGVGVGTTTPIYPMDVSGILRATHLISTTPYSCYVYWPSVSDYYDFAAQAFGPNSQQIGSFTVDTGRSVNWASGTGTYFTPPVTGLWRIEGLFGFPTDSGSFRGLSLVKNGYGVGYQNYPGGLIVDYHWVGSSLGTGTGPTRPTTTYSNDYRFNMSGVVQLSTTDNLGLWVSYSSANTAGTALASVTDLHMRFTLIQRTG
jgi:hypothetical protein